jgi:hypothetical protein
VVSRENSGTKLCHGRAEVTPDLTVSEANVLGGVYSAMDMMKPLVNGIRHAAPNVSVNLTCQVS